MLQLVEELSLRTRRVQPQIVQLEEFSRRMDHLRLRLQQLKNDPHANHERNTLRRELHQIMLLILKNKK